MTEAKKCYWKTNYETGARLSRLKTESPGYKNWALLGRKLFNAISVAPVKSNTFFLDPCLHGRIKEGIDLL